MTASIEPVAVVAVENLLGEGVQWNPLDRAFWWTDILGQALFQYKYYEQQLSRWPLDEKIASFCFDQHNRLLAAFASGFAWFDPATGEKTRVAQAETLAGNRSNDGRCDRQGRFWMGTIVEQALQSEQSASLYSLDAEAQITRHLTGLKISNGLCWSPDGKTLYHTDSPTHTIYAYDFDTENGVLGHARVFAKTEPGIEPDGACIDADGFMWNAQWGGARVRRYASDGTVDFDLPLPVAQGTCCAFGGDDYSLLAVTSARIGLSEEQLTAQPDAGSLFIFKTPYKGLPESQFVSADTLNQ